MKFEFSGQIFQKYSNLKFQENLAVDLFHEDWQTDMAKLIVTFFIFASAPKKWLETVSDLYGRKNIVK
jgi:hypothetical protein